MGDVRLAPRRPDLAVAAHPTTRGATIAELIDFSYDRFTPAEVKAAGRVGVVRYVASGRPLVSATRDEVDAFRAAGLSFVAVWQRGDDRALGGFGNGLEDARDAAGYTAGLGAGGSDAIHFAVDVDATTDQLPAVLAYFQGVASVLGWYRVGVYGGIRTLTYLRERTPLELFWQTASWSGGQLADFATLYQYKINQTLNGKAVDFDRSLAPYYGQWGAKVARAELYPGARWTPLGAQTESRMTAHDIVCAHTMVGYLTSTDRYFRIYNGEGYAGTESHIGIGGKWGPDLGADLDGASWQWQDFAYQASANLDGNPRVISFETADNAPATPDEIAAWTPAQVEEIVRFLDWVCSPAAHAKCPASWKCHAEGIPRELIPDSKPGRRGIGYHAQGAAERVPGGERWSTSDTKPCPAWRRIAQLKTVIIPRVAALDGNPPELDWLEELMALYETPEAFEAALTRATKAGTWQALSEWLPRYYLADNGVSNAYFGQAAAVSLRKQIAVALGVSQETLAKIEADIPDPVPAPEPAP